jgi:hypothetical protein
MPHFPLLDSGGHNSRYCTGLVWDKGDDDWSPQAEVSCGEDGMDNGGDNRAPQFLVLTEHWGFK